MSFQDDILDTSRLQVEGDFEAQVDQLLTQIRLTKNEVENLERLVSDVQRHLPWQGCEVQPFGSIVTGLGIRTSDIDCFIKLPPWVQISNKLVYKAKTFLEDKPQLFTELFAIPMAKVPIVKFYHIPTGRYCDINFSSYSGVLNSKLLAYLLHVDKRALPLAILVKYWSKVHNLTGTNLMPNYALTMLVVFYLQTLNILPSVHLLQQSVGPYMVDNWNAAFDHINYDISKENNLSLCQLLAGFFRYYSSFDFEHEIISTYLGRPVPKECFKKFDTVPEEFDIYKRNIQNGACQYLRINTKMCVQDPFEHSRNCSVAIHQKLFDNVLQYIQSAAKIFHDEQNETYLRVLLTKVESEVVPKKKKNKRQPPQEPRRKGIKKPKHNNFGHFNRNRHAMYSFRQNFNRNIHYTFNFGQNFNIGNIHATYNQYNQRQRNRSEIVWNFY